ncbi:MAG TPA: bifunctional diaminohydroxyphosphoribosylaminopyrimidine deaminase/5-amino-6-(5-phosphoribosylamino)uracil reductase RibD [Candidatus Tumulicola sp.]
MTSTRPSAPPSPIDRLFLQRAYELAARGVGSTAPNPPVGAVVVREGRIVGEGYHHRAGEAHAEVNALAQAGEAAQGATLYVSLEPCVCAGRVPPCAPAIAAAGVARVVAGAIDPNPKNRGLGVAFLRESGVEVETVDDESARALIEKFATTVTSDRPYVALKMAMSLDGAITSEPRVQEWITSEAERLYVRELRIAYDAVLVGAGTVRVDDPQLTVRPPHYRLRPFVRVVACESGTIAPGSRILNGAQDYAETIVLAPAARRADFKALDGLARMIFVGDAEESHLDLGAAMQALRAAGVSSVLCEGGPTLGARLIAAGAVDRFYWAIAPRLLGNDRAVPVLVGVDFAALRPRLRFDRVMQVGEDVVVSGTFGRV